MVELETQKLQSRLNVNLVSNKDGYHYVLINHQDQDAEYQDVLVGPLLIWVYQDLNFALKKSSILEILTLKTVFRPTNLNIALNRLGKICKPQTPKLHLKNVQETTWMSQDMKIASKKLDRLHPIPEFAYLFGTNRKLVKKMHGICFMKTFFNKKWMRHIVIIAMRNTSWRHKLQFVGHLMPFYM